MINKRIVLTVTSGRSGTGYLTEILGIHQDVVCFHEPAPSFEILLREAQRSREVAKEFWIEKKIPFINEIKSDVYIETSHLVCKGFLEPLFEMGIVPDVIILERASREISKSLFQLDTIPGRTEKALRFYLSPNDSNLFLRLPDWDQFNDYQLCFWYTLEILMRQKYYATVVKNMGGNVAYTSIEELNKLKNVEKLFDNLALANLSYRSKIKLKKALKNKANTKTHKKNKFEYSEDQLYSFEKEVYDKTAFFDHY